MARVFHCSICDKELAAPGICAECRRELDAPSRWPDEPPRQHLETSTRVALHVAGPRGDVFQRCARCGDVLAFVGSTAGPVPRDGLIPWKTFGYPEGALVERHRQGQGMYLGSREPDCPEGTTDGGHDNKDRSDGDGTHAR